MLGFAFILSVLFMGLCIFPQGIFGMCVAYRKRGPLHTDETGFPSDI